MLQFLNTDVVILVALAATAGGLSSVLLGKWVERRNDKKRERWEAEDQQRIDAINQNLNGGRDA